MKGKKLLSLVLALVIAFGTVTFTTVIVPVVKPIVAFAGVHEHDEVPGPICDACGATMVRVSMYPGDPGWWYECPACPGPSYW